MWVNNHKIIINHPWLGMAHFTPISRYLQISPGRSGSAENRLGLTCRVSQTGWCFGGQAVADGHVSAKYLAKRCHMALSKHEVYDKLAIFKIICSWGGWFISGWNMMFRVYAENFQTKSIHIWLVVWIIWIIFHFIYGMSSFPLTNSYFSRWLLHHQPDILSSCLICYFSIYWE